MTTAYRQKNRIRLVTTCCLLLPLLTACIKQAEQQKTVTVPTPAVLETRVQQLLGQGQILKAAQIYTTFAANSADPATQQDYALKAVEVLLDAGHIDTANEKLQAINQLPTTLTIEKRRKINAARAAIALGHAEQALELLPIEVRDIPSYLQIHTHRVRAHAHQTLGEIENTLLARIQLTRMLQNENQIAQNHQQIWRLLNKQTDIQLVSLSNTGNGRTYKGWIELANIVRNTHKQHGQLKNTLPTWKRTFAQHPAAGKFTAWLLEQTGQGIDVNGKIALLLPLNGKLGAIAKSIRDGFFAAYYADDSSTRPNVRLYDVSDTRRNILEYYALAVDEGAEVVVGPLDKTNIDLLSLQARLQVPTLGLNYQQNNNVKPPDNLFQFGLLPEDEARAVAKFAMEQGHTRAIAITQDNAWGQRLVDAFRRQMAELGGAVLDQQTFTRDTHDFSQPIKRLLNLNYSQARKNTLQNILRHELEFEPRRRQDVDFIFLATDAPSARGIIPQFKFYRGGDIPIYAVSQVFDGNRDAGKDADMEGLLVCNIPWLLSDTGDHLSLYQQVNAHWPQQSSLARLYALGIDAYRLLPHINTLRSDPDFTYAGHTGDLTLGANQRIQRHLQWARFINGVPVKLSTTPSPSRFNKRSNGNQSMQSVPP